MMMEKKFKALHFSTDFNANEYDPNASTGLSFHVTALLRQVLFRRLLDEYGIEEARDPLQINQRMETLEKEFGSEGAAQAFILSVYRYFVSEEAQEYGYSLSEETQELTYLKEGDSFNKDFYLEGTLERLNRGEASPSLPELERDGDLDCSLIHFVAEEDSEDTSSTLCFLNLDMEHVVFAKAAEVGRPLASLTSYFDVAAFNLLAAMVLEIPIHQHLGGKDARRESGRTGRLLGCLAELDLSETHLVQWSGDQEYDLAQSLPLYERMGKVSLLTVAKLLQRDEATPFRRRLLEEEALSELLIFPGNVFLFNGGPDQSDSKEEDHVLWRFSFLEKTSLFRFMDAAPAFEDFIGNWEFDEPCGRIRELLSSKCDEVWSFDVEGQSYRAPLWMIRLADFRMRPNLPVGPGGREVQVSDLFEILVGDDLRPVKTQVKEVKPWWDFDDTSGFVEGSFVTETSFRFDFLVSREVKQGRLAIRTWAEEDEDPAQSFGLKVREDSPESDLGLLHFFLQQVSVETELAPFFHGEDDPMISPDDFLNVRLALPSKVDCQRMVDEITSKVAGGSMEMSESLRKLIAYERKMKCFWPYFRPEDDLDDFTRGIRNHLRDEFDRELEMIGHQLGNQVFGLQGRISEALALFKEGKVEESLQWLEGSLKPMDELESAVEAITEGGLINSRVKEEKPYSICEFLKEHADLFGGGTLEGENGKPLPDSMTRLPRVWFLDIIKNILSNGRNHGGLDDEQLHFRVVVSNHPAGECWVTIANNGESYPKGFTTESFVSKGEKSGASGRYGLGGFHIKERMTGFGEVVIENRDGSEYPAAVILKFRAS